MHIEEFSFFSVFKLIVLVLQHINSAGCPKGFSNHITFSYWKGALEGILSLIFLYIGPP